MTAGWVLSHPVTGRFYVTCLHAAGFPESYVSRDAFVKPHTTDGLNTDHRPRRKDDQADHRGFRARRHGCGGRRSRNDLVF